MSMTLKKYTLPNSEEKFQKYEKKNRIWEKTGFCLF